MKRRTKDEWETLFLGAMASGAVILLFFLIALVAMGIIQMYRQTFP